MISMLDGDAKPAVLDKRAFLWKQQSWDEVISPIFLQMSAALSEKKFNAFDIMYISVGIAFLFPLSYGAIWKKYFGLHTAASNQSCRLLPNLWVHYMIYAMEAIIPNTQKTREVTTWVQSISFMQSDWGESKFKLELLFDFRATMSWKVMCTSRFCQD